MKTMAKPETAEQAKESRSRGLQVIGIIDGTGGIAGAIRLTMVEMIRGGLLTVECCERTS